MRDMVRLAVIGCGGRAGRLVQEVAELDQAVELVGVLDPDEDGVRSRLPERFAGAPFYGSVGELHRGARPTALLVGTRCHLHTEYAIEAVDLDLPLFLEKPVSISMEQARRLEAAYAGRYERAVVSFPLRVSSLAEMIAGRIRAGAVGSPEHIAATNYVSYGTVYWEQGYRDYTITGGLFLQKATHDFDYLAMLMGSPIVQVAAMGNYGRVFGGDKPPGLRCSACDETATCPESPENRRRNGLRTADDHLCLFSSDTRTGEGTNEDCSTAMLRFASGAHGTYTQVFFTRRDAHRRGAVVSGYQGTIEFDWYTSDYREVRHHDRFSEQGHLDEGEHGHHGGDANLIGDFLALARDGTPPRADLACGLRSVYTSLAARESAATGRFVDVRQLGAA